MQATVVPAVRSAVAPLSLLPPSAPLPSAVSGESRPSLCYKMEPRTAPLTHGTATLPPHRRQHRAAASVRCCSHPGRIGAVSSRPAGLKLAHWQLWFFPLIFLNSFKSQELVPTSKIHINLLKNHKNTK
jgi:hypothetical protein